MSLSRRFSVLKSFNSSWLTAATTKVTTERVCIKQCVATLALIAHCASLWTTCLFQPYYLSPLVSPLSSPFISFFPSPCPENLTWTWHFSFILFYISKQNQMYSLFFLWMSVFVPCVAIGFAWFHSC